jgi:hypothetical protein
MRISPWLTTTLAAILLTGCQMGKEPSDTLNRETYLAVYCDLLQESLRSRNVGADPRTAKQNTEAVLAKRGVTRAQFDSTTSWYNKDVHRWKGFFDDVAKELEYRELHPDAQTR